MARSAGFLLLKWLIIPAALAAAGYFFIGPRVGKYVKADSGTQAPVEAAQPTSSSTSEQTSFPAPDVEVKVGTAASSTHRPKRKKRRRTTKPKPSASAAATTIPADPGGSGGAATTGGDGTTGGTTGGDTGGGDPGGG
jgi:hypothetical protein